MKPSERMEKVLQYLDIGTVALATKCGLTRTRIRDLIANDAKSVAPDIADAITMNFPTISRTWLLYGEGEMIVENETTKEMPEVSQTTNVINELLAVCHTQRAFIDEQRQQINDLVKAIQSTDKLMNELVHQRHILINIIDNNITNQHSGIIASEPLTKQQE